MRPWIAVALIALLCADNAQAGSVTVRFRNTQEFPIYLQATAHDGVVWPYANSTVHAICGKACDCFALAPPVPRVRVVAPGGVIESGWSGSYYELQACEGEGPDCVCATVKQAAPGPYRARVEGAPRALAEGAARVSGGEYQEDVSPDPEAGACTAVVDFELGSDAQPAPAAIECEPEKRSARPR